MGQVTYEADATRVEFSPEQRVITIQPEKGQAIMIENPNKVPPKPQTGDIWVAVVAPILLALIGLTRAIIEKRKK